LEEAIRIVEEAPDHNRTEFVSILSNLGAVYIDREKWDDAAKILGRASLLLQHPDGRHDSELAGVLHNVGTMHYERGNLTEAQRAFQTAYELRRTVFGPAHPDVALSGLSLGMTLTQRGQYGDAEPLLPRPCRSSRKRGDVLCNPKNPGCRDEKYIKILLRHRREPGWRNIYFADPAYPEVFSLSQSPIHCCC
jgi:tetratricopeptide (TPR) repeat protein